MLSIMLYACGTKVALESVVLMNECTLLVSLRDCVRIKQVNMMSVEDLNPGMRDRVKILSGLAFRDSGLPLTSFSPVSSVRNLLN